MSKNDSCESNEFNSDLKGTAKGGAWKIAIAVALYGGIAVLNVYFISIIQATVNALPNVGLSEMLPEIFAVFGLMVAFCALFGLYSWLYMHIGFATVAKFLQTSFRRVLLNKKILKEKSQGELMSIGIDNAFYVSLTYAQLVLCVLTVVLAGTFQAVVLSLKSWVIMLVVVGLVLVLFSLYYVGLKKLEKQSSKRVAEGNKLSSMAIAAFENVEETFNFSCEDYQKYRFVGRQKKLFAIGRKLYVWQGVLTAIRVLLVNLVPITALGMACILFLDKNILVGDVFFIFSLAASFVGTVSIILEQMGGVAYVKSHKESMKPVWAKCDESGVELKDSISNIRIAIKGFAYESAKDIVLLKDLNAEIIRGELAVVTGESGCGKSTLFKFLSMEEELSEDNGEIFINDRNINEFSKGTVYGKMLSVPQKSFIFDDTLLNNLCLGEKYSSLEIAEVIETCALNEFEKEFGLSYGITENGGNISEGQSQRICLARMLLRKPNFLLLDEPTSALDKATADSVVENIKQFIKKYDMSAIMISHKPSDASFADKAIHIRRGACEVKNNG